MAGKNTKWMGRKVELIGLETCFRNTPVVRIDMCVYMYVYVCNVHGFVYFGY